jgi:hypothetical protein
MIKKILKYCIPAYLLSGVVTIIVIAKGHVNLLPAAIFLVVIIAIITGVGLLLGLIPSILIQRPAIEKAFYWIGQIISFIAFYTYFLYSVNFGSDKKTNEQENEATMRSLTDNGKEYFGLVAFDSLKLKFRTPDDFVLNTYTVFAQDSMVNAQKDPIYTVYFSYTLKDDKENELMAKYIVMDHQARLAGFNIDKNANEEFMRVYRKQEALKDSANKFEKMVN